VNYADDRLWTADDLAMFLGLSPRTVTAMASRSPGRLPARVGAMRALRWVPDVVKAWAIRHSGATKSKRGRPRALA
jgi:hypothetical protein